MSKPQLILDVAGILVSNLSPSYWHEIASIADIPYESLKARFNQEVRKALWTGLMSEEEFWGWLNRHCPTIEIEYARALIDKHLKRLPAMDRLVSWSQAADIHLLSNHRKEWLSGLLESIAPLITTITISSEAGCCKPDPAIFELVHSKLSSDCRIIYVDDQEKNLSPAKQFGWVTVIADQAGKWMDDVSFLLGAR